MNKQHRAAIHLSHDGSTDSAGRSGTHMAQSHGTDDGRKTIDLTTSNGASRTRPLENNAVSRPQSIRPLPQDTRGQTRSDERQAAFENALSSAQNGPETMFNDLSSSETPLHPVQTLSPTKATSGETAIQRKVLGPPPPFPTRPSGKLFSQTSGDKMSIQSSQNKIWPATMEPPSAAPRLFGDSMLYRYSTLNVLY